MMKLKQNRKVSFDDFTHTYLCGDKVLMGVTTLMSKHGLGANYDGIPQDVLAKAAERGSAIHKMLEDYDDGKDVIGAEYEKELKAYKQLGLNVICSEYLVSDNKMIASSIDKVLATDEENTVDLGDVKTTSTLHCDALAWQLGIYKVMFEAQNKNIKVRNCYGIHVRNGKAVTKLIEPVSAERVKALFKAEADGEMYTDIPEASTDALTIIDNETLATIEGAEIYISTLEAELKEVKANVEKFRASIYDAMMEKGITELEGQNGVFKLRKPTIRQGLDTEALKKEHPDICEKFVKESIVKGSISYKQNK